MNRRRSARSARSARWRRSTAPAEVELTSLWVAAWGVMTFKTKVGSDGRKKSYVLIDFAVACRAMRGLSGNATTVRKEPSAAHPQHDAAGRAAAGPQHD